ncbi:hypothetical protein CY35_09G011100 [Sphagnum magellanicum]|nr:hypothetical protein CY35_09G011100 [Sphagnum magellanicum]
MVGAHHRVVVLRPETPLHYCQETRHANSVPINPEYPRGIINNWHAQQGIQTTIGVLSMIQNPNRIIKATNNNSNPTLLPIGVDICAASAKILSLSLSSSHRFPRVCEIFQVYATFFAFPANPP